MASLNPFDLLVDDDTEDPNQLIAKVAPLAPAGPKKGPPQAQTQPAKTTSARLPSKPLPPSQAVREAKNDGGRGERGGRGAGRGGSRGRGGGRGFNRDSAENENSYGNSNGFGGGYRAPDDGEAGKNIERRNSGGPRGGFRGGRRGGFNDGDATEGERPRRVFERRSGTGRGNEFKREGSGRGNWGSATDEIAPESEEPVTEGEKVVDTEKQPGQEDTVDTNKDANENEPEEKEPEEKEMTLEEYEKVLEEKRKALLAQKPEERKVNVDKEFESMQLLSNKKNDEDVKLGSDKDKRKDATEKAKKSLTINEFLKPAEGESYYRGGGRGRGRGRGSGRGGYDGNNYSKYQAPSIQDVGQFPSLGGK